MPRRGRYNADPLNDKRSIVLNDPPLSIAPGELEWVQANSDENGIDPIEIKARRSSGKTEAERARQMQALLPHRSTVTPQMQVIHERRFTAWMQGCTQDELSDIEDVTLNAVQRSISYMLSLVSFDEAARLRNVQRAAMCDRQHSGRYDKALTTLLDNDSWMANDRGMGHFERIVGLRDSGINVNVDNRKQTANIHNDGSPSGPISFEEAFGIVRAELAAENQVTDDVIDATIIDPAADGTPSRE